MTFVSLQYPPVLILFFFSVILMILTVLLPKYTFIPAFFTGLAVIALLLSGLCYAMPLEELLMLILLLLLLLLFLLFLGCRLRSAAGKEGDS